MNPQVSTRQKGFTLVEMIVVIAIIAILAAVIIPTTASFIDRARLSNDRQTAALMNRVIETLIVSDEFPQGDVDADTVRSLLNSFGDQPFDFTPTARNVGYMYHQPSRRIVLVNYEQADAPDLFLYSPKQFEVVNLLALNQVQANSVPATILMPEQLFGEDRLLLSTSGSVVADIVQGIRQLGNSRNLVSDFAALESRVDGLSAFFRDSTHQARLENLLNAFDPATTLFVNNERWTKLPEYTFPVTASANISRIVFAPGTVNIPAYPSTDARRINIDDIVIPASIRSIEANAFNRFSGSASVTFTGATPRIMTGAFTAQQQTFNGITPNFTPPELPLRLAFNNGAIEFNFDPNNPVALSIPVGATNLRVYIDTLPRREIINLIVRLTPESYEVRVYTHQGLAGVTTIPIDQTT